jgi:hypothetical protein
MWRNSEVNRINLMRIWLPLFRLAGAFILCWVLTLALSDAAFDLIQYTAKACNLSVTDFTSGHPFYKQILFFLATLESSLLIVVVLFVLRTKAVRKCTKGGQADPGPGERGESGGRRFGPVTWVTGCPVRTILPDGSNRLNTPFSGFTK